MQPAIPLAPLAEIIDELAMPARSERLAGEKIVDRHRLSVIAGKDAEEVLEDKAPLGIEEIEAERQVALAHRHRGGKDKGGEVALRQDGERKQIAAAERGMKARKLRIGGEIAPLHVDMGDVPAPPAPDLVAGPHHVAPGAELELGRPAQVGKERPDIDRFGGIGADVPGNRHGRLGPHPVEAHRARRDGHRVRVLKPEDHPLAGARGGKPGIALGRPGIGVMGGREALTPRLGQGVERVFHYIVTGRADHVQKELAGEGRKAETGADGAAVEDDPGEPLLAFRQRLFPGGERRSPLIEETEPEPHVLPAIARPVIGGDEAGCDLLGVAEEDEVGGEIAPIEVGAGLGE